MKKFFIASLIIISSLSAFAAGGNWGGGGTGRAPDPEDVVVYFDKVDYDLIYFRVAYYKDGDLSQVNDVSAPLKGLDPRFLHALKMSAENNYWVVVQPVYRLPPAPPSAKRISNPNPI